MAETGKVSIFGIRHHGPGSARSLLSGLQGLVPDCILVEGPPEANALIDHVLNEAMRPPVALLIYAQDDLRKAVYYPFAVFSPEWQAIVYGKTHAVPVRFMDLPQTHWLALDRARKQAEHDAKNGEGNEQESIDAADLSEQERQRSEGGSEHPQAPAAAAPSAAVQGTESQPASTNDGIMVEAGAEEGKDKNPPEDKDNGRTEGKSTNSAEDKGNGKIEGEDKSEDTEFDDPSEMEEQDLEFFNIRQDPLSWLAKAAGYDDSERWWENLVEHRREDLDVFAAIREAMTTLRSELTPEELHPDEYEPLREAQMRQTIRQAQKEGFKNIAVVCGAWHAPALSEMPPAKIDQALLKGMPKVKVESTWIPWTHGRLSMASGYGAGVRSPGWYHHLWTCENRVIERWITNVARLLREQDLDASSAHVIEAVRLAEALASMRGQPLPGLTELTESIQTVLCHGNSVPLQLIQEKLVVGDLMGEVPPDLPGTPLQKDLEREQKRLRLPAQSGEKIYDLDLRNANDLARSHLLHRLQVLNIDWGIQQQTTGRKGGTFHEVWQLRWMPEFSIKLIESSVWGKTVEDAAGAFACDRSDKATQLAVLTTLLDKVLLADLPVAVEHLMRRVETEAAVAVDIKHLMAALPALVQVARYGNVRRTDIRSIEKILDALVSRICVGLPAACSCIDEQAALEIFDLILKVHGSLSLLQNAEHDQDWQAALMKLADGGNMSGLIAGRACRLLFDKRVLNSEEAAQRFGLALSTASEPAQAACWADGFLRGGGAVLIHDNELFQVVDQWVQGLNEDTFTQVLPLLRRTFSSYNAPERRQIGEKVARSSSGAARSSQVGGTREELDLSRSEKVLPVLMQLLGLRSNSALAQEEAN